MGTRNSILDITIRMLKQGGGDKDSIKTLVSLKTTVGQAAAAFAAFAGVTYTVDKALDASVGRYVALASEIEKLKVVTGAGAEETSRIRQMADDARVSFEDLNKALKTAANDGYATNIEGLAALSDEFLQLNPGVEQSQFLMDKFGKAGQEMEKIMRMGGDAIRDATGAIDESLIVTEEGIELSKQYAEQLDELRDTAEGVALSIGREALPELVSGLRIVNSYLEENNTAVEQNENTWSNWLGVLAPWIKGLEALEDGIRAINGELHPMKPLYVENREGVLGVAMALDTAGLGARRFIEEYEALSESLKDRLDLTFELQDGLDRFHTKQEEIREQQRAVQADFEAGNITLEERDEKLGDLADAFGENAKAAQDWSKKLVFSLIQARLAADGIDSGEFNFLIKLGEGMGLIDEQTSTMAQGINNSLDQIDLSKPEEFVGLWEDILGLPSSKTFYINTVTSGGSYGTSLFTGGTCFAAGTMVSMADGSTKPIEQVWPGDEVISFDTAAGKLITARVCEIFHHKAEEMTSALYLLINGRTAVTPNHPLYINGEWAEAGTLRPGDQLQGPEGSVAVETVQPIGKKIPTYNLEVDHESHNYFADGILAHNKAQGGVARGPGDGMTDGFLAPLANGEGVINARAMSQPGVLDLLNALNSGRAFSEDGGGRRITIYGGLTVIAQGSVMDVLEELR